MVSLCLLRLMQLQRHSLETQTLWQSQPDCYTPYPLCSPSHGHSPGALEVSHSLTSALHSQPRTDPVCAGHRSVLTFRRPGPTSPWLTVSSSFSWCLTSSSLVAQRVKRLPARQKTRVQALGREDPLEQEMAIYSTILAWRIPWMEEPDRLHPTGSQRVGHDWAISLSNK